MIKYATGITDQKTKTKEKPKIQEKKIDNKSRSINDYRYWSYQL